MVANAEMQRYWTRDGLMDAAEARLKRYLATREDDLPWRFLSERQAPLSCQAVNYIVRLARDKAKVGRAWPHMLRHSCGHNLADKSTDLRTMQDYLGHRDPKHTAQTCCRTSVRGLRR